MADIIRDYYFPTTDLLRTGMASTYTALEFGLTESQIKSIFALMDEVEDAIRSGKKPLNHSEFEDKVYEIVPSHRNDYHFAQSIVSSLNSTHQYQEVYQHMKRSGMNLR